MAQGRTKKLVTETAWFAIGNFGSKILSLLLVPLYTNILTTAEYGSVDILNTTIQLAIPLLTLSMQDAAFRYAFDQGENRGAVLTDCLAVTLLSPLVLLLLRPALAAVLPVLGEYWWYFFWIYVFSSLSSVLSCYLKGVGKTNLFAIQGILYTFAFAIANIVLLLVVKMRVEGYLLSLLAGYVVSCVYMAAAGGFAREIRPANLDGTLLREMLRFSLPLIPASVAWWIMTSIDRYMLLYMDSVAATGLYGVAHKLPSVITVLTNFFISAWQITAVRSRDDADIGDYTSRVFEVLFLAGTILAFCMMLASRLLGRLFFAKDFFAAWSMMPLLTVSTIFSTFSLFLGAQFTAAKRSDLHLWSNLLTMGVNIVLNMLLIPGMGASGAALATMISYFAVLAYRHVKVRTLMRFTVDAKKLYAASVCAMLAAAATALTLRGWPVITAALMALVIVLYRRETASLFRDLLRMARAALGKMRRTS